MIATKHVAGSLDVGIEKLPKHVCFIATCHRETGSHPVDRAVVLLDHVGRLVTLFPHGVVAKLVHTLGECGDSFTEVFGAAHSLAEKLARALSPAFEQQVDLWLAIDLNEIGQ
jgi:hypothetical protein